MNPPVIAISQILVIDCEPQARGIAGKISMYSTNYDSIVLSFTMKNDNKCYDLHGKYSSIILVFLLFIHEKRK